MWRFWRALPPKGHIGILFGSWYTAPIIDRVAKANRKVDFERSLEAIVRFERMLADEGALVLKFWFHLSKDAQRKRLKALESDPSTRWRVTDTDWARFKLYDRFRAVSEEALRRTSTGAAPWVILEGADARFRGITMGRTVLKALRERLDDPATPPPPPPAPLPPPAADGRDLLGTLDYTTTVPRKRYDSQLEALQGRLNLLTREPKFRDRAAVVVFEGSDAAGKGGAIRRITGAVDARFYQVVPVAAPTEEERAQPYLWRFWRHLPRRGRLVLFDRAGTAACWSSASRASAPRPTGCARTARSTTSRSSSSAPAGIVVSKFWLAITEDEQLRRFKEREAIGFKQFKITEEDWRNRARWADYRHATCDMIDRTSTELAPWTLVPANDKLGARLLVLETLCDRIEAAL
jgi:polyphosphate:AMP phosphotransferase